MSRAVTADHVLFNECIQMFRPDHFQLKEEQPEQRGYLFLDFMLEQPIVFEYFSIQPTIEVNLPGAYSAFIAPVVLPKWFEWNHNIHLFTIALSSVFSFVTGRSIKAPRDGYESRQINLDDYTLGKFAIQHPILKAGPGAHDTRLSQLTYEKIKTQLQETIQILHKLPYELYIKGMQSIRLVHLSQINKRDDFGLGYYLLISAIEPIATAAISRKSVAPKNPVLDEWRAKSKTNPEFQPLLNAYQQELSKNRYIGKRFVAFVMNYCPPDQWMDLEHPKENSIAYTSEISGFTSELSWVTQKQWDEIYPEDLNGQQIRNLLSDCYHHRSKFTHEGQNPPHKKPDSYNRFFDKETIIDFDEKTKEVRGINEIILPNFRLISFIATMSIFNFLKEKSGV
ncbi:hypothetical protein [Mesobacillus jeotgali]|uniref:hypothetical protein n=1 Tax=Mesobacillus jeotgali TaxID=129985 RepID=UPI0009A8A9C9|nr:hypothetical protein [Mesobacillus jeotgali]